MSNQSTAASLLARLFLPADMYEDFESGKLGERIAQSLATQLAPVIEARNNLATNLNECQVSFERAMCQQTAEVEPAPLPVSRRIGIRPQYH